MKKIILALLIFGAVVCAPVAKAEEFGLTQEMIQQAQTDPEYKALVISYLKTMIALLQEQLKVMIAQENILKQIAQNTAPSAAQQPAPAQVEAAIPKHVENPFEFTPVPKRYPSDLVMVIAAKFDKAILTITDENGNEVLKSDKWMVDNDGNSRIVYSMGTQGKHTYSVTCTKAGFDATTKTGDFPLVAE